MAVLKPAAIRQVLLEQTLSRLTGQARRACECAIRWRRTRGLFLDVIFRRATAPTGSCFVGFLRDAVMVQACFFTSGKALVACAFSLEWGAVALT